jgi:asparagine N-glycosylation enzyme membrane subunit Stt3
LRNKNNEHGEAFIFVNKFNLIIVHAQSVVCCVLQVHLCRFSEFVPVGHRVVVVVVVVVMVVVAVVVVVMVVWW